MVMMASAVDMAMAANVKSSRLAVTIRIKGMIPQMIESWSHTMGDSPRTNSSMLRKDMEDMPEEALDEVHTDEELRDGACGSVRPLYGNQESLHCQLSCRRCTCRRSCRHLGLERKVGSVCQMT